MTGLRLYAAIGALALLLAVLAWGVRVDGLRANWKSKYETLSREAGEILISTRVASDNPALQIFDVAAQIDQLGNSRRAWKETAAEQSARIDALGVETERLKALSAEARVKAEALIAKRDRTIVRLSDMAIDPGDRADCVAQLRDVEAALDLVYREGL